MNQVRCAYCDNVAAVKLPVECPTCTVLLNHHTHSEETWGEVRANFVARYRFDPAELFPKFRLHTDAEYIHNDLISTQLREVRRDIWAEEDARVMKLLGWSATR